MKRLHLFEFEDQKWFPVIFRDYMTEIIRYANSHANVHTTVLPLLKEALTRNKGKEIVDLCSGAAGLWDKLYKELAEDLGPISLTLTDKYPNSRIHKMWNEGSDVGAGRIKYIPESMDARNFPEGLQGMRTLFSGLHHFKADDAKKILKDAADHNTAIGVFECTESRRWAIIRLLLSPLFVWIVTPFLRPVTFARLFWTYIIPIIPTVFLWDAVVSRLRLYSTKELEKLTQDLEKEGYAWKIGSCRHTYPRYPIKVIYLLGYPE